MGDGIRGREGKEESEKNIELTHTKKKIKKKE